MIRDQENIQKYMILMKSKEQEKKIKEALEKIKKLKEDNRIEKELIKDLGLQKIDESSEEEEKEIKKRIRKPQQKEIKKGKKIRIRIQMKKIGSHQ